MGDTENQATRDLRERVRRGTEDMPASAPVPRASAPKVDFFNGTPRPKAQPPADVLKKFNRISASDEAEEVAAKRGGLIRKIPAKKPVAKKAPVRGRK